MSWVIGVSCSVSWRSHGDGDDLFCLSRYSFFRREEVTTQGLNGNIDQPKTTVPEASDSHRRAA